MRNRLSIATSEKYLVKNLDFSLRKGQTLGIVGESGSGKSLTSLAIMGLLPKNLKATGEILYADQDLLRLPEQNITTVRWPDPP
ncbi:MAG: ATP-binding cassette domain-containing protein [Owenweeksia sp.]|nr:ATP-binding cassette domain-containing protein [Owenweeksia sp.]